VLIEADAGEYEFTASEAEIAATVDGEVSNGLLNGGYATMTAAADANNYVLQKNGEEVNFYFVNGVAATVKPFRAYLTAPVEAPVRLFFNFDETTEINTPVLNGTAKSRYYNLQGIEVAQPQKGLYIVNGKKVVR
jgi:hypothetical protein